MAAGILIIFYLYIIILYINRDSSNNYYRSNLKKCRKMPQLIPFYFLNQLSFAFLVLISLIYIFSKYILPLFTFQQVIRMYITKLSNKI